MLSSSQVTSTFAGSFILVAALGLVGVAGAMAGATLASLIVANPFG
jgi:L-cystine uptake protein TcyP (sodium:dicarboxylate symporter family)